MIYYKLRYLDKPIGIDDSKLNVLVIENPSALYQTVTDLIYALKKEDSEFKFLTKSDLYKDTDKIFFACNLFDLDLNSKKVASIIAKQLTALFLNNEFEINEYYASGYNLFSRLTDQLDIPLSINECVDIPAFIKLFNPVIEDNHITLAEKIVDLTNVLVSLTNLKVFITLNIQDYLTLEEIETLFENCRYKELTWLSIQANRRYKYKEEHCVLIDNDLCQILE